LCGKTCPKESVGERFQSTLRLTLFSFPSRECGWIDLHLFGELLLGESSRFAFDVLGRPKIPAAKKRGKFISPHLLDDRWLSAPACAFSLGRAWTSGLDN
jgi:hypothetical protein